MRSYPRCGWASPTRGCGMGPDLPLDIQAAIAAAEATGEAGAVLLKLYLKGTNKNLNSPPPTVTTLTFHLNQILKTSCCLINLCKSKSGGVQVYSCRMGWDLNKPHLPHTDIFNNNNGGRRQEVWAAGQIWRNQEK